MFFNNKINDVKEFEQRIKAPMLGQLVRNSRNAHIAIHEGETSVSAELFRLIRTNLRFMLPAEVKSPVILVTSCINGDGKSYVSSNIALSLAILGKKVALVGLDIRKPMLATYMKLPNQGCLTSYIAEDSYTMEDLIIPSGIANLDVLPSGVVPPNPSELLQSEKLDQLFAELRQRYDYVIVDSAPVAMVGDSYLLQRLVDMTIYVTRANYTTYELVEFINQTHMQERLPKMVAVLNGVEAKNIGYGYGYGYGNATKNKK
jgi:capsular exopolysaccharide synthesis family protein